MSPETSTAALAWLLTYAMHSSVLLGAVWVLTRSRRVPAIAGDLLWKVALVGGIVTASVQQRLDVRPSGMITLATAAPQPRDLGQLVADLPKPDGRNPVAHPGNLLPKADAVAPESVGRRDSGIIGGAPASTAAVVAWGMIALVLALMHAGRRLVLVGRLGDRHPVGDTSLVEMLDALRRDVGRRRPVRLTSATSISSPVALGANEICVPVLAISDLDCDQQRSMLAHELAHLARRDPFWLDVASFIERVFFFQPLNRLARRELETTAEYLCDEWAAVKTGSGLHLARCLAQVAEWIQASPLGVPVAGMAEKRSLLVSRIARLLDGNTAGSATTQRSAGIVGIALLGGMVAIAPRVAGTALQRQQEVPGGAAQSPKLGGPRQPGPVIKLMSGVRPVPALASGTRRDHPDIQSSDSNVIIALIARLKDEDAEVRQAAARSLGQLEDVRAVPGLIETLKDPIARVRSAAADALASFEDPRAIAPLELLLADPSAEVRRNALDGLSRFDAGVPAAPIVRVLGDSDIDVRREAIHLLSHLGDRSAAAAIARLIHDPSKDVRAAVVEALGELGDATAGGAVKEVLGDPDPDVRQQALQALDQLKVGISDATLVGLLRDADADVRQSAAELAGRRSITAAVGALRQMLDDPKPAVREAAVEALGNMADPAAREALRTALTSKDPKVRRAAAEALGERK